MIRQIVKDYAIVEEIAPRDYQFNGTSAALKPMILHLFSDNTPARSVLDIGFGRGELGQLIRTNPGTAHWSVDGIDGFDVTCCNKPLFEMGYYRNIWHGYAQDLGPEQLKSYDVLCLLDVIEHLDAPTAKGLLRNLLSSLGENSLLFISTPLWFYPQDAQQEGDLEEHLIGVPATSMMSLKPLMYSVGARLVGNFVFGRQSLAHIDAFEPTTDRSFDIEQGTKLALDVGMKLDPGILFKITY
ncbi:class I SAM-dependent methyltransferase [Aquabacterium sp.]|uniref:class I SAM-dependent methyltransferase n=1 Tax=Aquabacterium sp. TaxID=1872578 RepID=UPI003D6D1D1F